MHRLWTPHRTVKIFAIAAVALQFFGEPELPLPRLDGVNGYTPSRRAW